MQTISKEFWLSIAALFLLLPVYAAAEPALTTGSRTATASMAWPPKISTLP